MSDGATRTDLEQWVRAFAQQVEDNKDLLTELDAAIGDADHGANMDRGLKAVLVALEQDPPATPATLFNKVGLTLVSTVGGASGPLYGTLFLRFGGAIGDEEPVSPARFAAALRAGLDGVVARGKAEPGDKTMYDALAPALDAFDAALSDGAGWDVALQRASPAKAAPATSANAASVTRTRARRVQHSSSRPPTPRCATARNHRLDRIREATP